MQRITLIRTGTSAAEVKISENVSPELGTALSSKAILTLKPLSACVLIKESLPALSQGPTQHQSPSAAALLSESLGGSPAEGLQPINAALEFSYPRRGSGQHSENGISQTVPVCGTRSSRMDAEGTLCHCHSHIPCCHCACTSQKMPFQYPQTAPGSPGRNRQK